MITTLSLQNFQSHEETTLHLLPGVNVIVGSSNSGKSALMRGLSWLINSRPSGAAFVSHWNQDKKGEPMENTSVFLKTEEGHEILRLRAKGINAYMLNGKTMEAVRTDVPAEITTALNLNEINVQRQMDGPFLLSESSAEVARFFNRIIRLDVIDTVLAEAERQRRSLNQEVAATTAEHSKIQGQIENLDWVDGAAALLAKATKVSERIDLSRRQIQTLEAQVAERVRLAQEHRRASKLVELGDLVDRALALDAAIHQGLVRWKQLKSSIEQHQRYVALKADSGKLIGLEPLMVAVQNTLTAGAQLTRSLGEYRGWNRRLEDAYIFIQASPMVDSILSRKVTADALRRSIRELLSHQREHDYTTTEINNLTIQLPDTCPVCGNPFKGGQHG